MKRKMMSTRCAVFDLDGTLLDSNKAAFEDLVNIYVSFGREPDYEFIQEAKTRGLRWSCEQLGRVIDGEDADSIKQRITSSSYATYETVDMKPHVIELLKEYQGKGVRMCVASATGRGMVEAVLCRLRIRDYFEFVLSVDDVGNAGKDKPDIFLACAEKFGEEDMKKITVFEDSLEAMKTAKKIGMQVVGVYDELGKNELEEQKKVCDEFVYDFMELLDE